MIAKIKFFFTKRKAEKIKNKLMILRITFKSAIAHKKTPNEHRLDKRIRELKNDFQKGLNTVLALEKLDLTLSNSVIIFESEYTSLDHLRIRYEHILGLKQNYLDKKSGKYVNRLSKNDSDSFFGFDSDGGHCSDSGGDCGGGGD